MFVCVCSTVHIHKHIVSQVHVQYHYFLRNSFSLVVSVEIQAEKELNNSVICVLSLRLLRELRNSHLKLFLR